MDTTKLIEERTAALDAMTTLNDAAAERSFTPEEVTEYEALEARVQQIDETLDRLQRANELRQVHVPTPALSDAEQVKERELRNILANPAPNVQVNEPDMYHEHARRSWFEDLEAAQVRQDPSARERLMRFSEEQRTGQSLTDNAGGYFVAPQYLLSQYAEVLRQGSPVADRMTQLQHPNTDAVKIPKFTSGTAVAVHSDNGAVQDTDAVTEEVSVSSYRLAGKQQLANRLVEFGGSYDKAILADLGMAIATKRDFYVIQGTGSSQPEGIDASDGINAVTYTAGTATAAGLWPKLLKAIQEVHEGAFESPDLIVMHPRRAAWLLAELDDSSRPFFTPVGPANGMGVMDRSLAGSILGIPVVTSTNVPTALGSGTDEDEIIVGIARHGWLWTNTPRFAVSTEEKFGYDATVVKAVQDMMFTAERQPAAWSLITGTGLNDVL